MREALVLVLMLLAAGCVAQTPGALTTAADAPVRGVDDLVHDLGEVLELSIPVGGDVRLHGTVYLPDVPEGGKVPVLMDMGPYYGNLNAETSAYSTQHPPNLLYEHFLRRGYAVALVSVRGTGQSGGCFLIGGPQERADVAAAVEWLAAQEWSNGNVGMTGVSYDGTTPWEGLVSGAAPSLKAIIPVESITDFYRYSFYEGVPVGGGAAFNTYYLAEVDVAYMNAGGAPAWAAVQPQNLCPEQAQVYLTPYQTLVDGVHGPYWDERDMSAMLAEAEAAVFVVHGVKDFNVKMDHVQGVWENLPGPKRMLIGQWAHNIPWRNSWDKEQSWHAYNQTMDQFLDAYLKEDPAALAAERAAPPVLVQDSANRTWNLTAWPPVESTDQAWHATPDGMLAPAPGGEGEATLRASPAAQAAGFLPLAGGVLPGESLAFETDAFAEDALFIGNPWVELNVTVDRPKGQLSVALYEVDDKGDHEPVSLGWLDLRLRNGRDKAEPVPVGEPVPLRIPLLGIAQHVEKGHKLVLYVAPENTETLTPRPQVTTFTVQLGGEGGLRVLLPAFSG